ncbi:hypothetical protein [Anoxybacillus sp. J5B_2022]|uniref:hypothetical protein n=1 Tax=Anoxybacillus sp. J5B_2022 TaxID=3003246 RepID=UPI0022867523|nr:MULTISPECIES: hypothetical protein [unclassified Anoxybacillus]MCL6586003.1 hypothetical protein [Anoxybacillus sp.]MCZ0755436.1 hypothetical protein [Anoxybacillus sp. J5B_2022]
MSLKLVELQIALPRTYDIAKIQEQLHHHPEQLQAQLTAAMQKQEERKNRQVTNKRTAFDARWQNEKHHQAEHPYKGTNIDLMG